MSRFRFAVAVAAFVLTAPQHPARASGDGAVSNWALNEFGGTTADRQLLFSGTPGVLMGTTPASLLFVGWRRLHGQTVTAEAGEALTIPCCNAPVGGTDPTAAWKAIRATVPGGPPRDAYIQTERLGPDYTSIPNCLDDAFRNATDTLRARIEAHGADTPEVAAWAAAQDAVFAACSKPVASLPRLPAGAPEWLRWDHQYQAAALQFYNADFEAAGASFAAIAEDTASPWSGIAPYLRVRAALRRALASKSAADFVAARDAARQVAAGEPFRAAAQRLGGMAELRAEPAAASARLLAALQAAQLTAQAASDFKDLQSIAGADTPELLDWIVTFKTGAAAPPVPVESTGTPLQQARAADDRRAAALAHARGRYGANHDPAWMLAALALMQPDDAADAGFMAEAAAIDPQSPAYPTALYHRLRLTLPSVDPAAARALLDTVLARTDLTATTRNLFLAERLQVATDLAEMARYAMRPVVCARDEDGCKTGEWGYGGHGPGSFDPGSDTPVRGVGDDARYVIDRMALAPRMALGADPALPTPIRLDLALTNFARAVLLHDDAAADALSGPLQRLLPPMAADFAAIPRAPPGPDRLFAEYMILAKIPGLRADLIDYGRPVGSSVAAFEGTWPNWVVLKQPDPNAIAPAPALYGSGDYLLLDVPAGTDLGNGRRRVPDPVCSGMCGAGGFVPRLPAFLGDTAARAAAERRFLPPPGRYGDPGVAPGVRAEAFPSTGGGEPAKTLAAPAGATYVWEFLLDYAARHPQDPRAPEVLHWLIHVGHYGQSHEHSGRRAFMLLRSRYPTSTWAKQNPFYYD